jgi:hypothetical protein
MSDVRSDLLGVKCYTYVRYSFFCSSCSVCTAEDVLRTMACFVVNWKRVQRLKSMRGLGVLTYKDSTGCCDCDGNGSDGKNLNNKPWSQMLISISQSNVETELFQVCTTITLGNDQCTKFWHDRWIQGTAPKEIASALLQFA